jgi:hypothetical protein
MAFSTDRPDPPTRFRASTGQIGQAAALKGLGRSGSVGGGKSQAERRKGGEGSASHSRLGLPQIPQQEGNNRHLIPALHHANIQDLGRDIPFGLWAIHNGYFPEIAGKDRVPFDWIEDGG